MSAPVARSSRPGGSNSASTRQQLDELDALLQRMLDLPVKSTEEEEPPTRSTTSRSYTIPESSTPAKTYETLPSRQPLQSQPSSATQPVQEDADRLSDPQFDQHLRSFQGQQTAPPGTSATSSRESSPRGEGTSEEPVRLRTYPASYMVVETTSTYLDNQPSLDSQVETPLDTALHNETIPSSDESTSSYSGYESGLSSPEEDRELARLRARLEQQGDWVPFKSSWQPSEQTWKPLVDSWSQNRDPKSENSLPSSSPLPSSPPTSRLTERETSRDYEAYESPHSTESPRSSMSPPAETSRPSYPDLSSPLSQTGNEIHRTPVSMDMPWSLGQAPQPTNNPAPASQAPSSYSGWDSPATSKGQEHRSPTDPVIPPAPDASVSQPAPPRSTLLFPLVVINSAFDFILYPLGPVGTWLRSSSGRTILGTIGLLCFAAAAALAVADGIGWTH